LLGFGGVLISLCFIFTRANFGESPIFDFQPIPGPLKIAWKMEREFFLKKTVTSQGRRRHHAHINLEFPVSHKHQQRDAEPAISVWPFLQIKLNSRGSAGYWGPTFCLFAQKIPLTI